MAESGSGAVVGRIFSVVGASLNFGGRRLPTIARVAFLPMALLLILDMAAVFVYLSIATGRFISFSDVATYAEAREALRQLWGLAWMSHFETMAAVFGAFALANLILISTFMAPLVRLAGLGEAPSSGVVRAAFGPDQLRFCVGYLLSFLVLPLLVLAPMGATAFYVFKYLAETLQQVYANFPDPESLHAYTIVTAPERLAGEGRLWVLVSGVPVAAAAPFALLFWATLAAHFTPPPGGKSIGLALRALGALAGGGGLVTLIWLGLLDRTSQPANGPFSVYLGIAALVVAILLYASVRMLPYAGIAVCRRSLAFGGAFRVTRGWRLIWTVLAILLTIFLINAVLVGVNFAFSMFQSVFVMIYAAADSAWRFANAGEGAKWLYPAFVTAWNVIKIVVNVFWAFFSYGVFAGLLGRLYRDSQSGA